MSRKSAYTPGPAVAGQSPESTLSGLRVFGETPDTTPRDGCAPQDRCLMRKVGILLGLVGAFLLVGIGWRLASTRRSLPCPVWLRWFVELDNPFTRTNRAATIIEHLELKPDMAVVDVGCGPGRVSIPLAERVPDGEVLAVDIQAGMLRRAKEKAENAKLEHPFRSNGRRRGKIGTQSLRSGSRSGSTRGNSQPAGSAAGNL